MMIRNAKFCILLKNLLYVKTATYLYVKPGIHCHFNGNYFHFNQNTLSSYFPFTCNGNKSQHINLSIYKYVIKIVRLYIHLSIILKTWTTNALSVTFSPSAHILQTQFKCFFCTQGHYSFLIVSSRDAGLDLLLCFVQLSPEGGENCCDLYPRVAGVVNVL